jgi:predicted ATPase
MGVSHQRVRHGALVIAGSLQNDWTLMAKGGGRTVPAASHHSAEMQWNDLHGLLRVENDCLL